MKLIKILSIAYMCSVFMFTSILSGSYSKVYAETGSTQITTNMTKPPLAYTFKGGTITIDSSKPEGSQVSCEPFTVKNDGNPLTSISAKSVSYATNSPYKGFNFVEPNKYTNEQWRTAGKGITKSELGLYFYLNDQSEWNQAFLSGNVSAYTINQNSAIGTPIGYLNPQSTPASVSIGAAHGNTTDEVLSSIVDFELLVDYAN